MLVTLDNDKAKAVNTVKIVFLEDDHHCHITVTHEGLTIDIVRDGKVVASTKLSQYELFDSEGT